MDASYRELRVGGMKATNLRHGVQSEAMNPMTIRMKDIARDLGLSVVTVSKVLRDHPDIGDVTR